MYDEILYPGKMPAQGYGSLSVPERYALQYDNSTTRPKGRACLGAPARVSAIVTARNYSKFLRQCLHSILAQTVRPVEILYADDGSTDDSRAVAGEFAIHGVRVLPFEHQGVIASRNRAAAASTGDFLLHVDGDNMLAPDFVERHLKALGERDAFAYCSKQYFDLSDFCWDAPEWDRDRLWHANFVDTSCLIRREAFEAVGGWKDTPAHTMWDWDLALRLSRHGGGARSGALLYYRHHAQNWSLQREGAERHQRSTWKGIVRRATARMTICTVFSGRLPDLFPVWLEALVKALKPGEREKPELFIIDDSPQGFFSIAGPHLARFEQHFQGLHVVRVHNGDSWANRRPDRAATARFLSIAYNRFLNESVSEVLWFIEDDIVVPPGAAGHLLHRLLDGEKPLAAVTGLYKSRHEDCYVVSAFEGQRVQHAQKLPAAPSAWDLAGTGCLMIFRPVAKAAFHPWWFVPRAPARPVTESVGVVPAHDWAFTWQLREQGDPVVSEPRVECRHHLTAEEWV